MTEHEWIKKVILPYFKRQGAMIVNNQRGSVYGGTGVADLHVTHQLWTGWLEIKGVKTRLAPTQRSFLGRRFLVDPGSTFVFRLSADGATGKILAPSGLSLGAVPADTCHSLLTTLSKCRTNVRTRDNVYGKQDTQTNYC